MKKEGKERRLMKSVAKCRRKSSNDKITMAHL